MEKIISSGSRQERKNGTPMVKPARLRIEVINQSVKKIDALNRAIIACRLKFWNALNNPVGNAEFRMLDYVSKNDIGGGGTDKDGEADVKFCVDIVSEIQARVDFVFNEQKRIRRARTFFLKDESNPRMQKIIDEIQVRHALNEDIVLLLADPGNLVMTGDFISKYGSRLSPSDLAQIMELLKQKRNELKRERKARKLQEEEERQRRLTQLEYEETMRRMEIERKENERRAWQEHLAYVRERNRFAEEQNSEFILGLAGGLIIAVGSALDGRKPGSK